MTSRDGLMSREAWMPGATVGADRQRYREVPLPGNKSKLMVTTVLPVRETFLVTFDVLFQKSLAPGRE